MRTITAADLEGEGQEAAVEYELAPAGTLPPQVGDPSAFEPTPAHDRAVQAALYRAAVGGETWAEQVGRAGEVYRVRKEVLPDPAAARKWLEARRPEAWADKRGGQLRVVVARLGADGVAVAVSVGGHEMSAIGGAE